MLNPLFTTPVLTPVPCRSIIDSDPLLYIDVTEALRRNIGKILYADETSCLIGFPHGDAPITEFTTLCGSQHAARRLADKLPWDKDILVAVHEDFFADCLFERFPIKTFLGERFYQVAYLRPDPVPIPESPFTVAPLTPTHLEQVTALHKGEEASYLLDRLESGVMLGAFDGDTLAGIIGIHGEGALGLLQVHPDYRRRGIGKLLEAHQINRLLALGHIPYASVLTDNVASLALQRSLGMTNSVPSFRWLQKN